MTSPRAFRAPLVVAVLGSLVACSTGRGTVPSTAVATADGADAAIPGVVVPAVHRARIGAVDVDASGRYLVAADESGFVALHDLERSVVLASHRVAEGGEPVVAVWVDAEATRAFVAFTQDEDDADAFAVWDLRNDRVTSLARESDAWVSAVGTNASIDTLAFVLRSETTRVDVRDARFGERCSVSVDDIVGGVDMVDVFVADDGSVVDVIPRDADEGVRIAVADCSATALATDAMRSSGERTSGSGRVRLEGDYDEQRLRFADREEAVPLSSFPTFARGGEFSVRGIAADPSRGSLFVATRGEVLEIGDDGAPTRCPGATALERTGGGDVLAFDDITVCDVAHGNAYEGTVIGELADHRLAVVRLAPDTSTQSLAFYDPRTGSFSDPPAFLAGVQVGRVSFLDRGRIAALRDGNGQTFRFFDAAAGREIGRYPAASTTNPPQTVTQAVEIGEFVGLGTRDDDVLVVDPDGGALVRTIPMANGYLESTGRFVRSGDEGERFVDVASGRAIEVGSVARIFEEGFVVSEDGDDADLVELATGRRFPLRGEILSFEPFSRDLVTCVGGHIQVERLDAELALVGERVDLGTCDAYARVERLGDAAFARTNGAVVELRSVGRPTISVRILHVDEAVVVLATDDEGRVAVLAGDASRLRYRPAGDLLTVELRPITTDASLAAEVHARLRGR